MNVVVTIQGRPAIPVRALPYATNWSVAPDYLAMALAAPADERRLTSAGMVSIRNDFCLPSYAITGSPAFRQMAASEWDAIRVEIDCLEKKLKANERLDGENWSTWRNRAISRLPHSTFVWLDEFRAWHRQNNPLGVPRELHSLPTDDLCSLLCSNDIQPEPQWGDLILSPAIPRKMEKAVFDGFMDIRKAEPSPYYSCLQTRDRSNDAAAAMDSPNLGGNSKAFPTTSAIKAAFRDIWPGDIDAAFRKPPPWLRHHKKQPGRPGKGNDALWDIVGIAGDLLDGGKKRHPVRKSSLSAAFVNPALSAYTADWTAYLEKLHYYDS